MVLTRYPDIANIFHFDLRKCIFKLRIRNLFYRGIVITFGIVIRTRAKKCNKKELRIQFNYFTLHLTSRKYDFSNRIALYTDVRYREEK